MAQYTSDLDHESGHVHLYVDGQLYGWLDTMSYGHIMFCSEDEDLEDELDGQLLGNMSVLDAVEAVESGHRERGV